MSPEEVITAVKRPRNGRAPDSDGIAAKLLKSAIGPVARTLPLPGRVWRTGQGKGPKSDCNSYRPITLLSVPAKVSAHVLLARIQSLLDMT